MDDENSLENAPKEAAEAGSEAVRDAELSSAAEPKSRVVYILLAVLAPLFSPCFCLLLPPLHNFYAGYANKALVQLGIWLGAWVLALSLDLALGRFAAGAAPLAGMALGSIGITAGAIVYIGMFAWCIVDAFTVTKDADGVPMA